MKTQIGREIDPKNPNVRTYTSHTELTRVPCIVERGVALDTDDDTVTFAEALLTIPGVIAVMVRPYDARVMKATSFQWDEIEPALLRLFGAFNIGEGRLEASNE